MPHLSSSEQPCLTPGQSTQAIAAAAGVALLMALAVLLSEGSVLFGPAGYVLGIIQGPLIDGPLIDLGNLLSDFQLGQFQQ